MDIDIWRTHQFYFLICLILWLGHLLWKKDKSVALALAYVLLNAVFTFNGNFSWGTEIQKTIDYSSAVAFGSSTLLAFIFIAAPQRNVAVMFFFLECVAVIDAILILIYGFGIFNVGTMDTTFLAIMVPGMLRLGWPGLIIASFFISTITTHGQVMAVATLVGAIMGYLLLKKKSAFWILIVIATITLWQIYPQLDPTSRPIEWKRFMDFWWENSNHLFGAGAGSFQWLGPDLQLKAGMTKDIYVSGMHNDHLQLIFEYGFVGYGLLAIVFCRALWKSRREAWLFSSLCAFAVAMIGYYPLQFLASQIALFCYLRMAIDRRSVTTFW